MHGGLSTGPRTKAGLDKAREATLRRHFRLAVLAGRPDLDAQRLRLEVLSLSMLGARVSAAERATWRELLRAGDDEPARRAVGWVERQIATAAPAVRLD